MADYKRKRMHKQGGRYSTRINGERVSYDITMTESESDEKSKLKGEWDFLLVDACKKKPKADK